MLRDEINRILFHVVSNEERADKIVELIAPELEKAHMKGYEEGLKVMLEGVKDGLDKRNEPGWGVKDARYNNVQR